MRVFADNDEWERTNNTRKLIPVYRNEEEFRGTGKYDLPKNFRSEPPLLMDDPKFEQKLREAIQGIYYYTPIKMMVTYRKHCQV